MFGGQPFTQRNADGRKRDVQRTGAERFKSTLLAEEDVFVGHIIEEHGERRIGVPHSFSR